MKLESAIKFKNGKKRNSQTGKIPVYGGNGILGYTNDYNAEKDNIIIGRVGAYCGCVYKNDNQCWVSDNAIVGNVKDGYDYNFMYYLLKNKNLNSLHIGSSHPLMTQDILNNIDVIIPNYTYQKKAAKVLSTIDKKVELNNQINDNLYNQAVVIYNNSFQYNNGDCSIGDYIIPKRGKNLLSRDAILGDVPVVAGGLEPATYHNAANTKAPVITISASGANAGYINLWNVPVWSSDSSYIDNSITENVYFWYVTLKIRQKEIFDAQTGSAQPHIYPQHIAELPIDKLNENEILQYEKKVTPFFKMIGKNKIENRNLEQLRDTLLPKLMNGEIDLNNIKV